MNLHQYLTKLDGKPAIEGAECIRLAKACGLAKTYIYLVAMGHKQIGPKAAVALEKHTNGKVKRKTLRPDIWGAVNG